MNRGRVNEAGAYLQGASTAVNANAGAVGMGFEPEIASSANLQAAQAERVTIQSEVAGHGVAAEDVRTRIAGKPVRGIGAFNTGQ